MKYRFEVIYRNKYMKEASRLLKKMDLDIGDVGISQVFTFTSKIDNEVSKIKEDLKKVFLDCDLEILHIEGGKLE